ncbi:hypothetical protein TUMEXPCC7403_07830 [Tumidithrix helvetica PCC 7403]|uniref:hypothetical protein n=1 Tax=Tumidithrix helvetica TaxID=3457545 RepID=UPI003CB0F591
MLKIGKKIVSKIRHLLPVWLYFFIAFNTLAFTKALMLQDYGIKVSTFASATIGSLVVAKVVLLVGYLPFFEPFPKIPIIYNVGWKTLLYSFVGFIFQFIEHAISSRNFASALEELGRLHFWALQIWLVLLLLIWCITQELIHVIGAHRMKEIVLGIRSL